VSINVKQQLTENMVLASTEFGIAVVQEIAMQSLIQKPNMSLQDFTKVLDQYVAHAKKQTAG
jgi:hypothetical protein